MPGNARHLHFLPSGDAACTHAYTRSKQVLRGTGVHDVRRADASDEKRSVT